MRDRIWTAKITHIIVGGREQRNKDVEQDYDRCDVPPEHRLIS